MRLVNALLKESPERMNLQFTLKALKNVMSDLNRVYNNSLKNEDFENSVNKNEMEKELNNLEDVYQSISNIINKSR